MPVSTRRKGGSLCSSLEDAISCISQHNSSRKKWFSVRQTGDKGRGVFAKKHIPGDTFLMQYAGELITKEEGEKREDARPSVFRYFFKHNGNEYCIDATREQHNRTDIGRLVNHGDRKADRNAKMKVVECDGEPHLCLFSTKCIQPNTEILYDYGITPPWNIMEKKFDQANSSGNQGQTLPHDNTNRTMTEGSTSHQGMIRDNKQDKSDETTRNKLTEEQEKTGGNMLHEDSTRDNEQEISDTVDSNKFRVFLEKTKMRKTDGIALYQEKIRYNKQQKYYKDGRDTPILRQNDPSRTGKRPYHHRQRKKINNSSDSSSQSSETSSNSSQSSESESESEETHCGKTKRNLMDGIAPTQDITVDDEQGHCEEADGDTSALNEVFVRNPEKNIKKKTCRRGHRKKRLSKRSDKSAVSSQLSESSSEPDEGGFYKLAPEKTERKKTNLVTLSQESSGKNDGEQNNDAAKGRASLAQDDYNTYRTDEKNIHKCKMVPTVVLPRISTSDVDQYKSSCKVDHDDSEKQALAQNETNNTNETVLYQDITKDNNQKKSDVADSNTSTLSLEKTGQSTYEKALYQDLTILSSSESSSNSSQSSSESSPSSDESGEPYSGRTKRKKTDGTAPFQDTTGDVGQNNCEEADGDTPALLEVFMKNPEKVEKDTFRRGYRKKRLSKKSKKSAVSSQSSDSSSTSSQSSSEPDEADFYKLAPEKTERKNTNSKTLRQDPSEKNERKKSKEAAKEKSLLAQDENNRQGTEEATGQHNTTKTKPNVTTTEVLPRISTSDIDQNKSSCEVEHGDSEKSTLAQNETKKADETVLRQDMTSNQENPDVAESSTSKFSQEKTGPSTCTFENTEIALSQVTTGGVDKKYKEKADGEKPTHEIEVFLRDPEKINRKRLYRRDRKHPKKSNASTDSSSQSSESSSNSSQSSSESSYASARSSSESTKPTGKRNKEKQKRGYCSRHIKSIRPVRSNQLSTCMSRSAFSSKSSQCTSKYAQRLSDDQDAQAKKGKRKKIRSSKNRIKIFKVSEETDTDTDNNMAKVTKKRLIQHGKKTASGSSTQSYYSPFQSNSQSMRDWKCYTPHARSTENNESQEKKTKREKKARHGKRKKNINCTVKSSSNKNGVRTWDKSHACLYCNKLDPKMPRHLEQDHSKETEVAKALSKPKSSNERKHLLDKLRYKGDYHHNVRVLKEGRGELIPWRRPPIEEARFVRARDYLPCPHCLAFFLKRHLWRHNKTCKHKEKGSRIKKRKRLRHQSRLLLPTPTGASKGLNKILTTAKNQKDPIYVAAKTDPLIMMFGSNLHNLRGHHTHLNQYIMQKMRELGRFLIAAREVSRQDVVTLQDCIDPGRYKVVTEAARKVAGFIDNTNTFTTPSLALKIGHSLKKCAEIVLGKAIMAQDQKMKNNAKDFLKMYEMDWKHAVSSNALRSLYEKTWDRPNTIPLTEDVITLHRYLKAETAASKARLSKQMTRREWYNLCELTLARVVLFNRRRGGETERLLLKTYKKSLARKEQPNQQIMQSLSKFERHLCKTMSRVVTRGKRGRKVPILFTKDLKKSVRLLVKHREAVGVHPENTFVFARAYYDSLQPLSAHACLNKFAKASGAKHPENLTSTRLRKHIATMSQVVNLDDCELEQLATYMGHSLSIHREYYRLPEDTLQVAKVSKLLMAMEKGTDLSSLNNISPHDKVTDESESESENGEDDVDVEDIQPSCSTIPGRTRASTPASQKRANRKKLYPKNGKKRQPKNQPQQKYTPWSSQEKEAVKRQLNSFILRDILPGKMECERCIANEPDLGNRSWRNVKDFVRNTLKTKSRRDTSASE